MGLSARRGVRHRDGRAGCDRRREPTGMSLTPRFVVCPDVREQSEALRQTHIGRDLQQAAITLGACVDCRRQVDAVSTVVFLIAPLIGALLADETTCPVGSCWSGTGCSPRTALSTPTHQRQHGINILREQFLALSRFIRIFHSVLLLLVLIPSPIALLTRQGRSRRAQGSGGITANKPYVTGLF